MRRIGFFSSFAAIVTIHLAAREARALTLPNSGTCSGAGNTPCLQINTNASNAIRAEGWAANTSALVGYSQSFVGLEAVSDSSLPQKAGILAEAIYGPVVDGYITGSTGGPNNAGVKGAASGSDGDGVGVWGTSEVSGSSGIGVRGQSITGTGVWGTTGNGGIGVFGQSQGSGFAVYGANLSPSGFAGSFNGRAFTIAGMWSGSDARLKTAIEPTAHGLADVLKLRPVTFKWKGGGPDQGTQLGLIAQEVQKVVPEVVDSGPSGMLFVNYAELLPVVIAAAQEQQRIMDGQEARLARLEKRRAPVRASLLTGGLGVGLMLLPVGALVQSARRRRRAT